MSKQQSKKVFTHRKRMPFAGRPMSPVPAEIIHSKIFFIRGQKVILDKDLAHLYGVTTGNLNKAVKRNNERFPEDFMFQLTNAEGDSLRFQIGSLKRGQHLKYLPYAFTEQGVAMLSSVLKSPRAIQVNVHPPSLNCFHV